MSLHNDNNNGDSNDHHPDESLVLAVPNTKSKSSSSWTSIFSTTCASSLLMLLYLIMVSLNLYKLMYPLAFLDLTPFSPHDFVHPLWTTGSTMEMKVYLSVKKQFHQDFLHSDFASDDVAAAEADAAPPLETVLLWKLDEISMPSLSKSFLLTNRVVTCGTTTTTTAAIPSENDDESHDDDNNSDGTCTADVAEEDDPSFQYAKQWLDEAEKSLLAHQDGGILSTISAAGQGIESTSVLLTMYQSLSHKLWTVLATLSLVSPGDEQQEAESRRAAASALQRSTIYLPAESPMWSALQSNSTLYIHVLVTRRPEKGGGAVPPRPKSPKEAAAQLGYASRSHSILIGQVDLIKYDPPHHLSQPGRILYHDVVYLIQKYMLQQQSATPPWDMQYTQPAYHAAYQLAQDMKQKGMGYPYWKPEVSVKYVIDQDDYPLQYAHISGMELVRTTMKSKAHPTGIAHIPALHVDEIGLTSEKYIPINATVTSLPLRITFDRNDLKPITKSTTTKGGNEAAPVLVLPPHSTTATAGGISPARWRLLSHLSESIESQKQLGFEQSDIDDVRRLVADTNLTLLAITMLASTLHLLFEFLTFKSEVSFWKNNTDLTGLSVRSLFLDFFGQVIIVLFLLEKDSSLLMTVPSAFGCLIALWKCQRAAGLALVRVTQAAAGSSPSSLWWGNAIPRLFGFEDRAIRLDRHAAKRTKEGAPKEEETTTSATISDGPTSPSVDLHDLTMESDRIATATLGSVLLPCVLAYTLYSLVHEEHTGWYSWLITSASSAVYALGFVLMTPQLFLNYKLKSVAHLPWRVLVYKSLNTFIDDLFSFIIRMPTMARISCFRDDVVFFIYLYQRWLYPVDASRPVEGGGDGTTATVGTESDPSNGTTQSSATANNPKSTGTRLKKDKKKSQ
jgi:hypothetical protein